MYEAECNECDEIFNPNDADDLEHLVKEDGTECGGQGTILGKWVSYHLKKIEDCENGDLLDMGVFICIDPRGKGQGPNTVNVRLGNGYHYTETANADVRVWQ